MNTWAATAIGCVIGRTPPRARRRHPRSRIPRRLRWHRSPARRRASSPSTSSASSMRCPRRSRPWRRSRPRCRRRPTIPCFIRNRATRSAPCSRASMPWSANSRPVMRAGRCWSRDRDGEQPVKRAGDLDDVYYAAIYFLYGQIAAHGVRYASRRFRADARPDATECAMRLAEWRGNVLRAHLLHELVRHHFRGVIPNVPAALAAWLRGEWPLQLCEHVPSARDVLRMQANGMRPVTLLADYARLLQPVLAKPSAWAYMDHDLEHAYKFFHDQLLHAAQRRFFERVARALAQGA